MKYCLILLCLFAAQIACSSVAQRKVIENFVKKLDKIDLIDPQWQKILEKVATKADAKSTCLFFKNSKCLLPLRTEVQRQKRKSNFKLRPFFLQMATNFTRKRFPKISQVITDIFSNHTSVGNDTSSQIEASSNLLILSTMEKLGDFANMLKKYQSIFPSSICFLHMVIFQYWNFKEGSGGWWTPYRYSLRRSPTTPTITRGSRSDLVKKIFLGNYDKILFSKLYET